MLVRLLLGAERQRGEPCMVVVVIVEGGAHELFCLDGMEIVRREDVRGGA
jgi:hypothetical protein